MRLARPRVSGTLVNDPALAAAAYQRAVETVVLGADIRPDGSSFASADATGRATDEAIVAGAYGSVGNAPAVVSAIGGLVSNGGLVSAGVAAVAEGESLYYVVLATSAPFDDAAAHSDFALDQDAYFSPAFKVDAACVTVSSPDTVGSLQVGEATPVEINGSATGSLSAGDAGYQMSGAGLSLWRNSFTWSSSDESVATVDDDGIVTASANGDVTIYANGPAGLSASFMYTASGAIEPVDLADATVAGIVDQSLVSDYATPLEPDFTVIAPDNTMIDAGQYTYRFENNVDPGEATLIIDAVEGSPYVTGQLVKTFEIQAPVSTVAVVPDVTNLDQGDAIARLASEGITAIEVVTGDPAPAAESEGLVEYTVPAAFEQVDVAAETVQVALYAAPASEEPAPDETDGEASGEPEDEQPGGEDGQPADEGAEPSEDDGQVPADDEQAPAEEGSQEGEQADAQDEEQPADAVSAQVVIAAIPDQTYTGAPIEPPVSVTVDGADADPANFNTTYENNVEVGTALVTVSPREDGAYPGVEPSTASFSIVAPASSTIDISSYTVSFVEDYQTKVIAPGQTAALEKTDIVVANGNRHLAPEDFEIVNSSENNKPGTGTAQIKGVNDYSGTIDVSFAVKGAIGSAGVSIPSPQTQNLFYSGSPITPSPNVIFGSTTLSQNNDYTLSYTNNVNAGTASITVTGTGNYSGTQVVNFTIQPKSIKSAQISPIAAVDYTGAPVTPAINVVDGTKGLQAGVDYDFSYNNNTNAGTAHVVVTGKGNYRDSIDGTFVINKVDMRKVTVVMPNMVYTGSALTPKPISVVYGAGVASPNTSLITLRPTLAFAAEAASGMKLVEGVDYDIVNYSNNVQVGEAKMELRGKGNFTGTKVASFKVVNTGTVEPGTTQTLPATGDDTNMPLLIGGIVGGVALVGAGTGLVIHSRKKNRK